MNGILKIPYICGLGLSFKLDGFRLIYALIAVVMWAVTALFSIEYFKEHKRHIKRYIVFTALTFLATVGVFFSADFFTTFIFFEIMSLTSYVWVAHNEDAESLRAASTYLAVAIIGGLVMLMGIFMLYSAVGTLSFDELGDIFKTFNTPDFQYGTRKMFAAGLCIMFGFAAKAGAFPLHIWLPKAHPVAPAPASALLSGILTKAGIFGIIVLSVNLFAGVLPWGAIILFAGVVTMFLGAMLALFSVDLKRTLACSSVSQIGFILVGISIAVLSGSIAADSEGYTAAISGAFMHMVNHSLIKLVLFCAAGVVFMNVKKLDLNDIRGFGRGKKLLGLIFLSGALSIAGVPLFSGYVSKTFIHDAITEYCNSGASTSDIFAYGAVKLTEWIFIISGGLTAAYMTKLYVCIFVEKNADENVQEKFDALNGKYMSKLTAVALSVPAVILPIFGILPTMTLFKLSELSAEFLRNSAAPSVEIFSIESIGGAAASLIIGAAVYVVIVRGYMMSRVPVNEFGIEDLEAAVEGEFKDIRTDKSIAKSYVNRWNKYIDLENAVYRPVILRFLPFVFGVISRFLDCIVDSIVVSLRKTVYKDSKIPHELEEGNVLTCFIGWILNSIQNFKNLTVNRHNPQFEDYEHRMAVKYEGVEESFRIVTRSLSFGLILFCIGLLLTVAYILFVRG